MFCRVKIQVYFVDQNVGLVPQFGGGVAGDLTKFNTGRLLPDNRSTLFFGSWKHSLLK